jgi:glycosyltransferase involved in cell wall biosynthesis
VSISRRTPATAPLKVLVVDHTAGLAGGEVALARLLHALDRRRFTVSALLLADGPLVERLRADDIAVTVLPTSAKLTTIGRAEAAASPFTALSSALRSLSAVPRIAKVIRGSNAELVVANSLKSAVLVSLAAPLAGRRWVWHLHDRIAADYLPTTMVQMLRILGRRSPRMIVANSLATRETMPSVPETRIMVAYPGVEVPPEALTRGESPATAFGLLGRIAPTKGQTEFLRAVSLLDSRLPDARYYVIGEAMFNDAAFADEIRRLPGSLGISDRVEFSGWAADPMAAIAPLTALVHASPVPEPFGQVLVEAMLAGVPVIATNAGGVPEILDPDSHGTILSPGVTISNVGILVEPGDADALADAMAWAASHPTEIASMAAAAQISASERFDIRRSARLVERVWFQAAGRPVGASAEAAGLDGQSFEA